MYQDESICTMLSCHRKPFLGNAAAMLFTWLKSSALDANALYLIERHLVLPPVVQPSGPGALVVGHLLGTSSFPPLRRYSVMPVARKEWQPIFVTTEAAAARRPTIR